MSLDGRPPGGSEIQSDVLAALDKIVQKLEIISERLPATTPSQYLNTNSNEVGSSGLELTPERVTFDKDVSSHLESHPDEDHEDQSLVEEEEQIWDATKNDLQDQNKKNIEGWKDEMNNLLIFAGLFSAVVTAFTVESYKWFPQIPLDNSDLYLARISLQLSSFLVTPTVINSSTSAATLPPEGTRSFFSPIAVSVNTLWVLSLTLSLISAFFAIAVQQWLRQSQVPPDIPVRKAVQILSLRSKGLQTWQVPGIISLLPLILQIAVVFFLAGLFLLLRLLNPTVTIAFVTVAAIALLAFAVTTIVPVYIYSCPYKTPLLPTLILELQWSLKLFPIFFCAIIYPLIAFFRSSPGDKLLFSLRMWLPFHTYVDVPYGRLLKWINTFKILDSDITHFWTAREHRYLSSLDEEGITELENASIAHVFISTSSSKFARVTRGLRAFSYGEWCYIVCRAIVQSIKVVLPRAEWTDIIGGRPPVLQPRILPYFHRWISFRHHRLLWRLLQQRDWTESNFVSQTDGEVLALYHSLSVTVPDSQQAYLKHLVNVCDRQRFASTWECYSYETVPGCIMLQLATRYGDILNKKDILRILQFSRKCLLFNQSLRPKVDEDATKLFLAAGTSILNLASTTFDIPSASILKVLGDLNTLLIESRHHVGDEDFAVPRPSKEAVMIQQMMREDDTDGYQDPHGNYVSILAIVHSLCEALENLAKSQRILRNPDCPSILVTGVFRSLLEDFQDTVASKALKCLDQFNDFTPYNGNILLWRIQAVHEARLDVILEQGMEAQVAAECEEERRARVLEVAIPNVQLEEGMKALILAEGVSTDSPFVIPPSREVKPFVPNTHTASVSSGATLNDQPHNTRHNSDDEIVLPSKSGPGHGVPTTPHTDGAADDHVMSNIKDENGDTGNGTVDDGAPPTSALPSLGS